MNFTRIQYFVTAASLENFSKAAQELYVSQPNLSKQIGLMEQELGFDLFRRVGKNVQLTRAGQYLYEQFRDLPELTDKAIAHAQALSRGEEGSLSVGVLEGQDVNFFLSSRIAHLREAHPSMVITMERNSFRNLRHGLDRGSYDVLFTLEFELQQREDWESHLLMRQPGAIAISRSHPLARRDKLSIEDFRHEPFVAISREDSPGGYALLLDQCGRCGFVPNVVRETSTLESLFLCVEMGVGGGHCGPQYPPGAQRCGAPGHPAGQHGGGDGDGVAQGQPKPHGAPAAAHPQGAPGGRAPGGAVSGYNK